MFPIILCHFHAVVLNIVCRLYMSANSINYTCYVSAGVSSDCEILSVSPTQDTDYQNLVSIIHVDPVRLVIDWSIDLIIINNNRLNNNRLNNRLIIIKSMDWSLTLLYGLKELRLHYWYCAQWNLAGSGINISHIYATSRWSNIWDSDAFYFYHTRHPKVEVAGDPCVVHFKFCTVICLAQKFWNLQIVLGTCYYLVYFIAFILNKGKLNTMLLWNKNRNFVTNWYFAAQVIVINVVTFCYLWLQIRAHRTSWVCELPQTSGWFLGGGWSYTWLQIGRASCRERV